MAVTRTLALFRLFIEHVNHLEESGLIGSVQRLKYGKYRSRKIVQSERRRTTDARRAETKKEKEGCSKLPYASTRDHKAEERKI